MPALRSSNLTFAEYDAETRTLEITFKSGGGLHLLGRGRGHL